MRHDPHNSITEICYLWNRASKGVQKMQKIILFKERVDRSARSLLHSKAPSELSQDYKEIGQL